ncbi:hypothetical protein K7432_004304 [Basidiobolus ranarum]|uniref:Carbohydrate-binding module family 19 domain-containing protein n=1 Tax=Basidiobolus ranarum TaxID=34480 RepID=A0ABR2WYF0_9FUNG
MKFQASATLLALVAFYSVQVVAQDSASAATEVSVPTVTDGNISDILPTVTATETATATEPVSDSPSSDDSSDSSSTEAEPSNDVTSTEPAQSTSISSETDSASILPTSAVDSSSVPSATLPTVSESSAPPAPTEGSGECEDGKYQCVGDSSPEFKWCVFGKWTPSSCAQGTICKTTEGSIACDWPTTGETTQ